LAVIGNPEQFSDLFPGGLVSEVIALIIRVWGVLPKPNSSDLEVLISGKLCVALRKEKNMQKLPFQIHFESMDLNPDSGRQAGRIDIKFIHSYNEDAYLAFECKRLRISHQGKLVSNADRYVGKDGMMCFLFGKYGKSQKAGGMIGYVMDGENAKAITSVKNLIEKRSLELCLKSKTSLNKSDIVLENEFIRETSHTLPAKELRVYHLFLGVK
jgi:hypothetical protein